MALENIFIHHRKPRQFIYWGDNYLEIFRASDKDKRLSRITTVDNMPMTQATPYGFQEITRELLNVDTGIILNSGQFIFNIFEFDKIPLMPRMRDELVEWRLKKVFPEDLGDYQHDYFRLSKNRIFSVLFKKELHEKIEAICTENGISLIYLGNSTVETINRMATLKKDIPDFFVEIDRNLSIMVFMTRGIPYYIRKFRTHRAEDVVDEVLKTLKYVGNSYSKAPRDYCLVARHAEADLPYVREKLAAEDLRALEPAQSDGMLFPL